VSRATIRYKRSAMSRETITLDQVRHVAKLGRLALSEAQLLRLAPQLEAILQYVNKIAEVDTAEIEPMAQASSLQNVMRDDVVEPALPLESVLMNAPDVDGRFFKVPKIIGADDDSAG
jgi:aspartyl-tRNA(Asn)/glutamyl-tRNA(Gln) amidotransferase subunit C